MARLVRFRVLDGIAVITLDAPPLNALTTALRAGLWDVFQRIGANDDVEAVVLTASGAMFSAGGDISEFEGEVGQPSLGQLCDAIELCPKPVVAAAFGQALGGGAELLLAAHYRLVAPKTRIGLPEVVLGLVPSAGGTQRLPRLIGPDLALQMMLSSNSVEPDVGKKIGLIDGVVEGDLTSGAVTFARALVAQGKGPRPTRANRSQFTDGRAFAASIASARASLGRNPQHAPDRILDCVEAAALLPFEAGLEFEADAFARCLAHPQSQAFRHVFQAERRIDSALLEREGAKFVPVVPMGKVVVRRLKDRMVAAAEQIVAAGASQADVDAAMVEYGFRRGAFGTQPEPAANSAIQRKIIAALVAEGGLCVDQGAVQRPADVDVLAIHGIGFPRRKGGPMRAAQTEGLLSLRNDMRVWAEDSEVWAVPETLDAAVKVAAGFDAIK